MVGTFLLLSEIAEDILHTFFSIVIGGCRNETGIAKNRAFDSRV